MEVGWKSLRIIPRGDRGALLLGVLYFAFCSRRCSSEARADDSNGDDLGFLMDKVILHLTMCSGPTNALVCN
jgi:hypothetical protein